MDGLEEKLNAVLSDPSAMEQIMSMARSLGLGAPPQTQPPPPQDAPLPAPQDDPMLRQLVSAMAQAGAENGSQSALFRALRPFVRPEKREKLDRAARVAQLAHIAGAALRGLGDGPGGG